jgi:exodeoxyribonuclease-3
MSGGLKLLTWNVNSIRARLDPVLTYLDEHPVDFACLQETKVENPLFPKVPFMELGYHVEVHGTKGLAGVATLSRAKPIEVIRGFRTGPEDRHARLLECRFGELRILNVYVPNGQSLASEAFTYKLEWLARVERQLQESCEPSEPLVICGDFNIAPDHRDVWSVEAMHGHTHFSPEEHRALAKLQEFGLRDCFRKLEDRPGMFTWFDYRGNAWEKREGLRIDLVLASVPLWESCRSVLQDLEPRGAEGSPSDHVPVVVEFSR